MLRFDEKSISNVYLSLLNRHEKADMVYFRSHQRRPWPYLRKKAVEICFLKKSLLHWHFDLVEEKEK